MSGILVDRHQADLFYAIQRLFEDRLHIAVYTPVGREWWDSGIWRFGHGYGDDRLVRQFLDPGPQWDEQTPGLYLTYDPAHPDRRIYGVSLEYAQGIEWRAVMATVQDNQAGFAGFAKTHGSAYLYHVGNTRQQVDWGLDPVVLNSTADVPMVGRGARIGQEFDKDTTFAYRPPPRDRRSLGSFLNLLPLIPDSFAAWSDLRVRLDGWDLRSYGHHCPDGVLQPVHAIADTMADTAWAFHDKVTGDGFGHVLHNWAAVGRPLVGHARYYQGQRGEVFWQDMVTCIDLDKHSSDEAAYIMATMPPEQHETMCRAIRAVLDQSTDWEADAAAVAGLL